jgi:branched-chain amino acid transport system permease protein
VSDDSVLAAVSGIAVDRTLSIVWILGGALAALGGALLGLFEQVSWQMGNQVLLLIIAGVTLGGLGTVRGALIGSVIVGVLTQVSVLFLPAELKYVTALLLLIVILLLRPSGIFGRRSRVG